MIKRILLSVFCISMLSSCIINDAGNLFRRGEVVCSKHQKRLRPVIVLIDYGFAGHTNMLYGPPYLKRHYSGGCVVRIQKFSVMYHCPKCERQHRKEETKKKNAAHF